MEGYLLLLYAHNHNNTTNTDERRFFINICTVHFICKGSKRLFKVCV